MADDVLKKTFKELKMKNADLSSVIDTCCVNCCRDASLKRSNYTTDPTSPTLLSPTFSTLTTPSLPGFYILKGALSRAVLQKLVNLTTVCYPSGVRAGKEGNVRADKEGNDPVRSNLSCLGETSPPGRSPWTTRDEKGVFLIDKLRWISMGYHFDWTNREYRKGFISEFPGILSDNVSQLVNRLDICKDLVSDSALVNFYHPGDTLSFHTDELEWDLTKPLVSISLGLPAVLCVGGTTRTQPPQAFLLGHGDVIVLSGESRVAYHAVPKVFSARQVRTCNHGDIESSGTCNHGDIESSGTCNHGDMESSGTCNHGDIESSGTCNHGDIESSGTCNHGDIESSGTCNHGDMESSRTLSDVVEGLDETLLSKVDRTITDLGEFQSRVKEYLSRTRINVSIRQVEKY